ncbi:hypothetical protein [Streptomyces sp. NPDC090057]|uniref:hypothetical protein n=1 Tax=Streptomyces sp. NPDC090057 TaxID=3365935 RepID=UPI0038012822
MAGNQHQAIRRAFMGAALGCAVTFLLASCSDYPVEVTTADQLTGVWSDWTGATVEFKDDGTFTAKGLDKVSDVVDSGCSGFTERLHGSWSPTYGTVTFDGVDCKDMRLAFHGSPDSFVACFTRDMTSEGCANEFNRKEG